MPSPNHSWELQTGRPNPCRLEAKTLNMYVPGWICLFLSLAFSLYLSLSLSLFLSPLSLSPLFSFSINRFLFSYCRTLSSSFRYVCCLKHTSSVSELWNQRRPLSGSTYCCHPVSSSESQPTHVLYKKKSIISWDPPYLWSYYCYMREQLGDGRQRTFRKRASHCWTKACQWKEGDL